MRFCFFVFFHKITKKGSRNFKNDPQFSILEIAATILKLSRETTFIQEHTHSPKVTSTRSSYKSQWFNLIYTFFFRPFLMELRLLKCASNTHFMHLLNTGSLEKIRVDFCIIPFWFAHCWLFLKMYKKHWHCMRISSIIYRINWISNFREPN